MTVYDIPNIEHCTITTVGTSYYRIICHEGWYVHLADDPTGIDPETGEPTKLYRGAAILSVNYDFSTVEITAEADLPANAEICGGDNEPEHEVM